MRRDAVGRQAAKPASEVSPMTDLLAPQSADLTVGDRIAQGKAARRRVPRSSHGEWEPAGDRPNPVALLRSQGSSGYRNWYPSATVACWPRSSPTSGRRGVGYGLRSRLHAHHRHRRPDCGDAHLSNFGIFGTPSVDALRRQRFRRDAGRPVGMGREAVGGQPGRGRPRPRFHRPGAGRHRHRRRRSYRTAMFGFAGMSNLDVWYGKQDALGHRDLAGPRWAGGRRRSSRPL